MKEKKEAHDRKRNAPPVDPGEGSSSGKKAKRTFNENWRKGRPWLLYENGLMFCTDCRNGDSKYSSQYTTGCESMKLDSINRHENSTNHKKRQAECLAAKREKNAEPEAGQTEATRAKQMWVHNMKPELTNLEMHILWQNIMAH